jgi:hypothetical protein
VSPSDDILNTMANVDPETYNKVIPDFWGTFEEILEYYEDMTVINS